MRSVVFILLFVAQFGRGVLGQAPGTFVLSFDPTPDLKAADKGKAIWSIGKYIYVINGYVNVDEWNRKDQIFMIDADTRDIVKEFRLEGGQGDIVATAHCITQDGYILLTGEWLDRENGYIMRMFLAKLTADLELVWMGIIGR